MQDGLTQQLAIVIFRANQATAIIRAITLSTSANHPLFMHLWSTQYLTLIVEVGKLFDKSGTSLLKAITLHKSELQNTEYLLALKNIEKLEQKFSPLLLKMKKLRNSVGAHIDSARINRMFEEPNSDNWAFVLNDLQDLINDIINFIQTLSFFSDTEKAYVKNRIGPKDVQDLLHLKTDPLIIQKFCQSIFLVNK